MRRSARSSLRQPSVAGLLAGAPASAAEVRRRLKPPRPDGQSPQTKPDAAAAENARGRARRSLCAARRLQGRGRDRGVSAGFSASIPKSGSDTADLLLKRARQAIGVEHYAAALEILDATVTLLPDWAEGWNARATARYLDDDYKGSMADIAQTLKREPKRLGALMGMGTILEAPRSAKTRSRSTSGCSRSPPTGATPRRRPTGSRRRWPAPSFNPSPRRPGAWAASGAKFWRQIDPFNRLGAFFLSLGDCQAAG